MLLIKSAITNLPENLSISFEIGYSAHNFKTVWISFAIFLVTSVVYAQQIGGGTLKRHGDRSSRQLKERCSLCFPRFR